MLAIRLATFFFIMTHPHTPTHTHSSFGMCTHSPPCSRHARTHTPSNAPLPVFLLYLFFSCLLFVMIKKIAVFISEKKNRVRHATTNQCAVISANSILMCTYKSKIRSCRDHSIKSNSFLFFSEKMWADSWNKWKKNTAQSQCLFLSSDPAVSSHLFGEEKERVCYGVCMWVGQPEKVGGQARPQHAVGVEVQSHMG